MVNPRNLLGLEPEPKWESMDWLRAILKKQKQYNDDHDDEAEGVWRSRTNISFLLYHLELSAREEYFNKHGALLRQLAADDQVRVIRKGKRSSSATQKRSSKANHHHLDKGEDRNPNRKRDEDRNPKRKRCEEVSCVNKKRKTSNDMVFTLPYAPPVALLLPSLPLHLKNYIATLGGSSEDAVLVIEKRLFKSDVNTNNNRFSTPLNQVKSKFLTQDEMNFLDAKTQLGYVPNIEVILIEPCLLNCRLNLKIWDMSECKTYVLAKGWRSVAERNRLHYGMMVQLWSFRVASQLWFALVQSKYNNMCTS